MDPIVLTDKSVRPDEELVFSIIGENRAQWQNAMEFILENFNGITQSWNYYNDGKSWLLKTDLKKKTFFWTGVQKDTFRVSFWFAEKAEQLILQSKLPEPVKEEYRNAKRYKFGRAITIIMRSPEDVESFKILALLKSKLK
jgi:hypothetical protein